jgi:hypothetical protein
VRAKGDHAKESMLMTKTRNTIPSAAFHLMAAALALLSAASPAQAQYGTVTFYGGATETVIEGDGSIISPFSGSATLTLTSTNGGLYMDILGPGITYPFYEYVSGTIPGTGLGFAGGPGGYTASYDDTGTDITAGMSILDFTGTEYQVTFQGSTLPEPSSIVTLATGIVGLATAGIYRRRRLRRKAAA